MHDSISPPKATRLADMECGSAKAPEAPRAWRDCPLEEKIERLRNELRQQRHVVEYAASTATQAHDLSRGHSHDIAGRVTVLADDRTNRLTAGTAGRSSYDPLA